MTLDALNIAITWPEIFLLVMACVVLVVDVFIEDNRRNLTYLISQLTLLVTASLVSLGEADQRVMAFNDMFVQDQLADTLKLFILAITFVIFVYSRDYLRERNIFKGEFYVLGLFGVLGMMIMVSASNMLLLYLGLELMSLCLYAMVAFDRDNGNASEAAMKYFVLGAIASGMLLYGMSILYGLSGSLAIADVANAVSSVEGGSATQLGLVFALVFIVVALAFKLGAVPFHMWIPDVYQGAPTVVTAYISSAPKIAGFAMIMRLLVEGMGGLHADWQMMLVILAVLSMAAGNIIAIAQANIKRMLAYSTISHVGFILLGILAGTADGYSSAMFYTLSYAIMSLGGFGIVMYMARAGFEAEELDDYKGLNQRNPWFAFMMLILMFSMAGVPPTLGFWAKLAVLSAVVDINMTWLAVVGVAFSIIGLFYYLRVVKLMYFDDAVDQAPVSCGRDMQITLSTNSIAILALGIYPAGLMSICTAVFN
ncbi:MAG: NADH-quinone oxidoreductase subunit NuoN [Gammaproteobacteria bacterium]